MILTLILVHWCTPFHGLLPPPVPKNGIDCCYERNSFDRNRHSNIFADDCTYDNMPVPHWWVVSVDRMDMHDYDQIYYSEYDD